MVAQRLDYAAVGDGPLCALPDHPLQLGFQRRQLRDPGLHRSELLLRDDVGGCAGLVGLVGEAQKVADGVQRKPEFARVANESQPILCGLSV
jgi:hypothetical protein